MKRFIKVIVPILLSVAIIASIGWYLFEYDTEFTRDQLVGLARTFEADGNAAAAIQLYNLAYKHSDGDQNVALELAELFRDSGNYTKAEYTLSNAIADGGGLDLYMALCRIFIEQDKILDAVHMLDNVSDPVIKAQLESMRPKPPVVVPDEGRYNDYINVSFQPASGTIYATFNGGYPSIENGPFTQPVTLTAGETTVRAVIVEENGLVSPLKTFNYTVAGVVEPVTLTDSAIDRTVRQLLQVDEDHIIYSNELWKITALVVPSDAKSLADLVWMPFLEQLAIKESAISDLAPLAGLSNLEELIITGTTVSSSDLAYIAGLPELTSLTLSGCNLSSISEISAASGLTYLDLSSNTIGNILPLSGMKKLEYVDVSRNALTSLAVFSNMQDLAELYASYNSIPSATDLSNCPKLAVLDLTGNQLTDLKGIENLTALRGFYVAFNQLTDISGLEKNVLIGDLDISNNQITDITALSTLDQLRNFNFSHNKITKLPDFSQSCPLVSIKGSSNQLASLEQLRGLRALNFVTMDQNPGLTSVEPLVECYLLVEVSLYGTNVTDARLLTEPIDGKDRNITVFYAPIPVN